MSPILLVVLSVFVVAAQSEAPRVGLGSPTLGLTRIDNGIEAVRGEFPHQVSLQWGVPPLSNYKHFCGGTIIGSQWILTAGHCVRALPSYGSFIVKSGKHMLSELETGAQMPEVAATYVHDLYVGGSAPNDIALLKLKSPLTLNKNTSIINLPKATSTYTGPVIVSGWGSISPHDSSMPTTLRKNNVRMIDFKTCKAALNSITDYNPLQSTNVCTQSINGGAFCSGDSGGPLISKNAAGISEVIGVVSWGIMPCGTEGAPSVYTGVASFVDWIQSTMKAH